MRVGVGDYVENNVVKSCTHYRAGNTADRYVENEIGIVSAFFRHEVGDYDADDHATTNQKAVPVEAAGRR